MSKGPVFSSISVRHASCQPYIMLFEAVGSSALASVETACLPAGCGLDQIKSLIHEGGWLEEWGNRKVEQKRKRREREEKRRRDEGIKSEGRREWVNRLRKKGGVSERGEDKNDPIDGLHPGLRIDEHLSQVSVISPTNHAMTSAVQYHTLQALSSDTLGPLQLYLSSTGGAILLERTGLFANPRYVHNT